MWIKHIVRYPDGTLESTTHYTQQNKLESTLELVDQKLCAKYIFHCTHCGEVNKRPITRPQKTTSADPDSMWTYYRSHELFLCRECMRSAVYHAVGMVKRN